MKTGTKFYSRAQSSIIQQRPDTGFSTAYMDKKNAFEIVKEPDQVKLRSVVESRNGEAYE